MVLKSVGITLLILVVIGALFAFNGCRRHGHSGWHSAERKAELITEKIADELDLDEQQQKELNRIKSEFLARKDEFTGIRTGVQTQVVAELSQDELDQAAINAIFEEREVQFGEMRNFAVSKLVEFHAILTPEQKAEMTKKLEKFSSRSRHW